MRYFLATTFILQQRSWFNVPAGSRRRIAAILQLIVAQSSNRPIKVVNKYESSLQAGFREESLIILIADGKVRLRSSVRVALKAAVPPISSRETMWKRWQLYCVLLHLCAEVSTQKTALDSPFNIKLLRAFRNWTFDVFGMYNHQSDEAYETRVIIFLDLSW